MKEEEKKEKDEYGTTDYCTCDKYNYGIHSCPYSEEINDDDSAMCMCCPYCERQCYMDI